MFPTGDCAAGHYCPMRSTVATQQTCPSGTYRNITGGRALGDCVICPEGSYCPGAATLTPSLCARGTYNRDPGGIAALIASSNVVGGGCKPCVPGGYCPDLGTIEPLECGVGKYSNASATSCS